MTFAPPPGAVITRVSFKLSRMVLMKASRKNSPTFGRNFPQRARGLDACAVARPSAGDMGAAVLRCCCGVSLLCRGADDPAAAAAVETVEAGETCR